MLMRFALGAALADAYGGAAYAATCLVHRTASAAGEKIVSPYGVDRTGRANLLILEVEKRREK